MRHGFLCLPVAVFQTALRLHPSHMTTLQNYAIFLEEVRGDWVGAEEIYNQALKSTALAVGLVDQVKALHHCCSWCAFVHNKIILTGQIPCITACFYAMQSLSTPTRRTLQKEGLSGNPSIPHHRSHDEKN
jgi:hypothetical protein